MDEVSTKSPLYDSDLEGAAHLCLEEAATTDLDGFPPGSGQLSCRLLHEREERFKEALRKRMMGVSSLLELGLSAEDCSWAATQAHRAIDPPGWELRFRIAVMRLTMASLQKNSEE